MADSAVVSDALNKLGVPIKVPWRLCNVVHPFPASEAQREELSRDHKSVIELLIPAKMYKPNPRSIMPDNGHPDTVVKYRQLLKMFGWIANSVVIPRHRKEGEELIQIAEPSRVTITWEVVPRRDSPEEVAAYRLRVTEHNSDDAHGGLAGEFRTLLYQNDSDDAARLRKGEKMAFKGKKAPVVGEPSGDPTSHTRITSARWRQLCEWYMGGRLRVEGEGRPSDYSLLEIFSPENSILLSSLDSFGADKRFLDEKLYLHGHSALYNCRLWGFADPFQVWRVSETNFNPHTLDECQMPMHRASEAGTREFEAAWVEQHGDAARPTFDRFNNLTSMGEKPHDIHAVAAEVREAKGGLRAKWLGRDSGPGHGNGYMQDWRKVQLKQNFAMNQIIHPNGDVSPSVQSIAAARDAYLHHNGKTLRLQRDYQFKNLTRFGNFWVVQAAMFKTGATVATAFKQCISSVVGAMAVYRRSNMNFHVLNIGTPGSGKSFTMLLVRDLFIDHTTLSLSNITPKALMTPGKMNDCLIVRCKSNRENARKRVMLTVSWNFSDYRGRRARYPSWCAASEQEGHSHHLGHGKHDQGLPHLDLGQSPHDRDGSCPQECHRSSRLLLLSHGTFGSRIQ